MHDGPVGVPHLHEKRPIGLRGILRLLFVRADKLYPNSWWCPACGEVHYSKLEGKRQNWKS